LIWFNLICQVILLAASWISVGMTDAGLIPDPRIAEERRKEAQERAQEREARKAAVEAQHRRSLPWWRRVLTRRKHDGGPR
ncbi:MAG TPA: YihY/virulence factor BrkB family protein, partial [Homoserinimonas sp.]|nr:YihY/virulence factor BrkB family protein [Homoserinimonas sp.]